MDATTRLRHLVAPLVGVGEADLGRNSQLAGRLKTSIGRATLEAVLRREFGTRGAAVYRVNTFGELEDVVLGKPTSDDVSETARPPAGDLSPLAEAGCGIDIERIDQFPDVADFWDAAFYRAHFTPDEIAYCVRQESPREHFAARWCAKESLRKCDPRFMNCAFDQIEIIVETGGRIRLATTRTGSRVLLPHAVSISHVSNAAVALVFWSPAMSGPTPAPSPLRFATQSDKSLNASFPLALTTIAILAFVLSLWGLIRSW